MPVARHSAGTSAGGTPTGGRFAPGTHREPTVSLADLEWAREVTGTTRAETEPRYIDVMDQVFAVARAAVDPDWEPDPLPNVAQPAVFPAATEASFQTRPGNPERTRGTVTGRADSQGYYTFTPADGTREFQMPLHYLDLPANAGITSEHYAANLHGIAGEYQAALTMRFKLTQANTAAEGALAAARLAGSIDGSADADIQALAEIVRTDAREATALRTEVQERENPVLVAANARVLDSGLKLAAALGYAMPDAEE